MTSAASERVRNPAADPAAEAALRESFAQLLNEGVDIVLGTDAGAVPDHPFGYKGYRELERICAPRYVVDAGIVGWNQRRSAASWLDRYGVACAGLQC